MKAKKQIDEHDYIGGQGLLTKQEEAALNTYFAKNKKPVQVAAVSVRNAD